MNVSLVRATWGLLALCGLFSPVRATPANAAPAVAAPAVVTASASVMPSWSLVVPQEEKITYRGVVSFDQAGAGTAAILYPAPNLVGLLAAVLTHSVIADSAQKAEKTRLQAEADKVLVPYLPLLDGYRVRDLMKSGLDRAKTGGDRSLVLPTEQAPAGRWTVESVPIFSMTQDQKALVLDNAILVRARHDASAVAFQGVVRVVSHPQESVDLTAHWTANQGGRLKGESASLLAESLDIAMGTVLQQLPEQSENQRTIRYAEGGNERMERAHVVVERCDRVVIKTLRGEVMSVPRRGATPADCPAPVGVSSDTNRVSELRSPS